MTTYKQLILLTKVMSGNVLFLLSYTMKISVEDSPTVVTGSLISRMLLEVWFCNMRIIFSSSEKGA